MNPLSAPATAGFDRAPWTAFAMSAPVGRRCIERILPAAAAAMSQREWNRLGDQGRAWVLKSRLFIQLGVILSSMPPEAAAAFLSEMPATVRMLYRLLGRRQYLAHRRRVYGTAA